jgi:two-component sensor histidine kinase
MLFAGTPPMTVVAPTLSVLPGMAFALRASVSWKGLAIASLAIVPQVAHSLALAIVDATDAPVLLLHQDLCVIAASASFCRAYGFDPYTIVGTEIFELGGGEWNRPQLRSLLMATANGQAAIEGYEFELKRGGRPTLCLIAKAHKLNFSDAGEVRLLLTVVDITVARDSERLRERLIQEKAVLMQEIQHRVANSLQIIASILLQSARKVSSDESKSHLHDAHHRVMSVASVQQQLATSQLGDVELRPYFTQLCASIGASMIANHDRLTLGVTADDSVVPADVSVSLGLIVTELVINALKHAFPEGRGGHIGVDYHSRGPNWTLLVEDDGVGMPVGSEPAKAGLGTTIVEALAKQLHAKVHVVGKSPGTEVQIVHTQIAAVADPEPEVQAV